MRDDCSGTTSESRRTGVAGGVERLRAVERCGRWMRSRLSEVSGQRPIGWVDEDEEATQLTLTFIVSGFSLLLYTLKARAPQRDEVVSIPLQENGFDKNVQRRVGGASAWMRMPRWPGVLECLNDVEACHAEKR